MAAVFPGSNAELADFARDGARHLPGAFGAADLARVEAALEPLPASRPGARLEPAPALRGAIGPADAIAASILGPSSRAVRALLLDKSPARNWTLGWHQDRTVALRRRLPVEGFSDWTVKGGIVHAEPPFRLLERMLTLRIHLDPAGAENAPLRVAPGSHRLGRVAEPDMEAAVARLGAIDCLAKAGDVWVYAAPILHASDRAAAPSRRRVLQLSYSADDLPDGLEWLGV